MSSKRITWAKSEDLECLILADMGMNTECISSSTGLSPGQIAYRLKKASIKRSDYRSGKSAMAQRVIERFTPGSPGAIRSMFNLKTK